MDQNESLLCQALLSLANFQSQNDSERKEREATYRWFHGLETKVQQNYLSSVPLSEVTIQILQYCLDSPKITSSVESLTAVCFAAIVHRKKSPSNVSNKKVYNRPTCRVSSTSYRSYCYPGLSSKMAKTARQGMRMPRLHQTPCLRQKSVIIRLDPRRLAAPLKRTCR